MAKVYYVKATRGCGQAIYRGTIEYLVSVVFRYTLECGNSWNNKITRNPKTIKGLVSALNKSAMACQRWNDDYEVSSEEEWNKQTSKIIWNSRKVKSED